MTNAYDFLGVSAEGREYPRLFCVVYITPLAEAGGVLLNFWKVLDIMYICGIM